MRRGGICPAAALAGAAEGGFLSEAAKDRLIKLGAYATIAATPALATFGGVKLAQEGSTEQAKQERERIERERAANGITEP